MTPIRSMANPQAIEAAILAVLDARPEVTWTGLRRHLPGTPWQQVEALIALHERGAVHACKVGRTTVVAGPLERRSIA